MTHDQAPATSNLRTARNEVIELLKAKAVIRLDEPALLSSGERSRSFVDVKAALADGRDLSRVCETIMACAQVCGFRFNAVGGPLLGAVPISAVIAVATQCQWFAVRPEPKQRGLRRQIEGVTLGGSDKVLLIEDVVTTGATALSAVDAVQSTDAWVVGVVAVVDRAGTAAAEFTARAIPYFSLAYHEELGIDPVLH